MAAVKMSSYSGKEACSQEQDEENQSSALLLTVVFPLIVKSRLPATKHRLNITPPTFGTRLVLAEFCG